MLDVNFKYPMFTRLQDAGADIKSAVSRMMDNEDLVNKFLLGFPDPVRLETIKAAVAANDYKTLEEAVHKIKGTAGNLGLTSLHIAAADFTDHIRKKLPEHFEADLLLLTAEYSKYAGIITEYL